MRATAYTLTDVMMPHSVKAKAHAIKNGTEDTTPIRVLGGKVSVDANADVRRRATGVTLVGYRPEIDPFTTELKLFSSINDEWVPVGVFRIEDPEYKESDTGVQTSVSLFDRAHLLRQLRCPTPYRIAAGTNVITAVKSLLLWRCPWLTFVEQTSSYTMPETLIEELADPWGKAQDMAASAGMELFFDVDGKCVIRTIIQATASAVVNFGVDARILDIGRKTVTQKTYSHAIAVGESTNIPTPVRAEAVDNNTSSPTYYKGPFGDRPTMLKSPFIATVSQAQAAADSLLARSTGRSETVSLVTLTNPALDAGDVVTITRTEIGASGKYIIDSIDFGLGAKESMSIKTRERQS